MTSYSITVTEAELAIVEAALERNLAPRKVAAPRTVAPVEAFTPATGDARLDAFMLRSRTKNGVPKPPRAVPAPKFPFGLKVMDKRQRADAINFANSAVTAWRRLGHEVIVDKLEHGRFDDEVAIDWRNVRVLPLVS